MQTFSTGIETLVGPELAKLAGRRVGLVAHPASVTSDGTHTARLFHEHPDIDLVTLLGPEHGFVGTAGAGEEVADGRHAEWDLPVHSLYGNTRKPTAAMLDELDVIVFDLQDLGVRCYTYVSTLRNILEAAAEQGKSVIVADRPIPQPSTLDGPMLDRSFESFVGCIPASFVYGMTPGETAVWMTRFMGVTADLAVSKMAGYTRDAAPAVAWPQWVPPSPAIRSPECALAYAATVYCEALPALDCSRSTDDAFRVLRADWMDAERVCASESVTRLAGVDIVPESEGPGIRLMVREAGAFKPIETGITILAVLQEIHGVEALWGHPETRESFFDQLMGTDTVREMLHTGRSGEEIAMSWREDHQAFMEQRESCLLYA